MYESMLTQSFENLRPQNIDKATTIAMMEKQKQRLMSELEDYDRKIRQSKLDILPSETNSKIAGNVYDEALYGSKRRILPSNEAYTIGNNELNTQKNAYASALLPRQNDLASMELDQKLALNPITNKTDILKAQNAYKMQPDVNRLSNMDLQNKLQLSPLKQTVDVQNLSNEAALNPYTHKTNMINAQYDIANTPGKRQLEGVNNAYNIKATGLKNELLQPEFDAKRTEMEIKAKEQAELKEKMKNMNPIERAAYDGIKNAKDLDDMFIYNLEVLSKSFPELYDMVRGHIAKSLNIPVEEINIDTLRQHNDEKKGKSTETKGTIKPKYQSEVNTRFKLINDVINLLPNDDNPIDLEPGSELLSKLSSLGIPKDIIYQLDSKKSNMLNKKILDNYFRVWMKKYIE